MADVSFTATAIIPGTNAQVVHGTAGEAITRGAAVYLKASDNEYYLADCTAAATDAVAGFALNDAANGQRTSVLTSGNMTCDNLSLSITGVNAVYVLSESGAIAPVGDLAADDYVTVVGVATSATNLLVNIAVSGAQATA